MTKSEMREQETRREGEYWLKKERGNESIFGKNLTGSRRGMRERKKRCMGGSGFLSKSG